MRVLEWAMLPDKTVIQLEDWSDGNTEEYPNLHGLVIGAYPTAKNSGKSKWIERGDKFRLHIPMNSHAGYSNDDVRADFEALKYGGKTLEDLADHFYNGERDRWYLGMSVEYKDGDREMEIKRVEKYLEEVAKGTDFSFTVEEESGGITLYMHGDNPEGEDWCEIIEIKNPKTKKELLASLHKEVSDRYESFDAEENVLLLLEAKKNGVSGIPYVVDLVRNEDYKENALREFANKLGRLA